MKIAIIAIKSSSGETGGAEKLYQGLYNSLISFGINTELFEVTSNESNFESIKETYLKIYDLKLNNYDGVISTKAPSYLINHKNHICYLIHTMRVFYDMFDVEFPNADIVLHQQRRLIHTLDSLALAPTRTKKIFSIGNEVSNRLWKYNHLESEVLHPALLTNHFQSGESQDYIFLPGRLHRWKRVDLAIRAMDYTKTPVKLKIAGSGEDEGFFRKIAHNNPNIEFLGRVSDEKMIDLYSNSLAVAFFPIKEDYGYVTLEAFSSEKPVITCTDSGEPTFFVKNKKNGFVCDPSPQNISEKFDYFYQHRDISREMGVNGKETISHINWYNIAQKLILSLGVS